MNGKYHPDQFHHQELAMQVLRDNEILYQKIENNCGVSLKRIPLVLTEVVCFLNLVAFSGRSLTPSKAVDDSWHEFILCTKSYQDFCEGNFGRMIHHSPGGTEENNRKQFQLTLQLYQSYIGKPDSVFWGVHESPCGNCESL